MTKDRLNTDNPPTKTMAVLPALSHIRVYIVLDCVGVAASIPSRQLRHVKMILFES